MDHDLVSIGMPVYNGEPYLEAAIRSNLEQTYPHLELIIADNASTDRTEEICRAFARADERVRYIRNEQNVGAARNYGKVFEAARGPYFRWANADDLSAPTLVERTLPVLQSRPDVVIAYGRTCLVDERSEPIEEYQDNLDLQNDRASQRYREFNRRVGLTNIIYGLMRSAAMARTALMGDGKLPAGDISFMAAMSLLGKFVEIPETLFYRRMHQDAFSANPDPEEELHFWNATTKGVALPHWRAGLADVRAIMRAPLQPGEKMTSLYYCGRRMARQRAQLTKDLLHLIPLRRPH